MSPTYCLSKYLARVLGPLVGKSSSSVRNSAEFAGFITAQLLQLEERFVSFYVVSLFIRILIDLAISVAKCRQESDKTLEDRTFLSVSRIVALLKLYLEAMYLTFGLCSPERNVYHQHHIAESQQKLFLC